MKGEKNRNETKHLARLLAVQFLFTKFQNEKEKDKDFLFFEPNTLLAELERNKFDSKLYEKIIDGVTNTCSQIDEVIETLAPAWPLEQINLTNLVILRAAIWEAFIAELTAPTIVIDQAIELAKALSSGESSSFVNGVLANILNNEELKTHLKQIKVVKEETEE
jgi:N utilization substance protein B